MRAGAGGKVVPCPHAILGSGEVKLIFWALRERDFYIDYEAFK
jgi:hypothetical protein